LQGMLLKHRGGSGFGPGRLTGPEVGNFEQLAVDVSAILRDEARHAPSVQEPAAVKQMAAVQAAQQAQQAVQAPSVPAAAANSQPADQRINGMIACMEGAIQMYKHSPPEMQEGVLVTLRAALLSAVSTCNDIIANNEVANVPNVQAAAANSQPADQRINGMIACMEGAIQMYKHSPPEMQEGVLVTLRAALLSAVSTCNGIIANNEVANVQAYQTATLAPEAVSAPAAPTAAPKSLGGIDDNSQVLQQVYSKLKAAAGDGKMGLRKGLDPQDASELADNIAEMRSLLVGELDGGIPEPTEQSSSGGSKYQELLAKAKAEKEAKNGN
jgi:hypothetical protein